MTRAGYSRLELRAMHTALSTLANRRLPTVASDLRVAKLLRALSPIVEPLTAARQKISDRVLDGLAIADVAPAQAQLLLSRIAGEQAAFDAEREAEAQLPETRLTTVDLPKETSGEEGWKNAAQVAAIIADLGPLFTMPEE